MKNYSFQGLRGLFAIGVLFSHCYFLGDYAQSSVAFDVLFRRTANVSFFFMISGYFLFASVAKATNFSEYIKKKIVRIYPLHIILLILLVANSVLNGNFEFSLLNMIQIIASALLVQTWIPKLAIATSYNTVSWFLSSLLFCYIIGYLLGKFIKRDGEKAWKATYALTAILFTVKVVLAFIYPTEDIGYYLCYLCPLAGLSDLLIGAIISHNIEKAESGKVWLQTLALTFVICSFFSKTLVPTNFSRAFLMVPANILLIFAFANETNFFKKIIGNKFFVFLGDISFEIYLMHAIIIGKLSRMGVFDRISNTISPFVTLLILIIICVVCALVYKKVVDIVFKHIKQKPQAKKQED